MTAPRETPRCCAVCGVREDDPAHDEMPHIFVAPPPRLAADDVASGFEREPFSEIQRHPQELAPNDPHRRVPLCAPPAGPVPAETAEGRLRAFVRSITSGYYGHDKHLSNIRHELDTHLDALLTEAGRLRGELKAAGDEREADRLRKAALQDSIDGCARKVASIAAEKRDLTAQLTAAEAARDIALRFAEIEVAPLRAEISTLRQEASTGEEYRDVLRAERDAAVKQVKAHRDNARQAESQRDVAVNATEAVLVAFKQLERDLAQTKALYSDMYDQFLASQRDLAASRETVEAQGWQPIETAPKDGSSVMLAWVGTPGMTRTGYWMTRPHVGWTTEHGMYIGAHAPTHWQPLPPAPSDPQE